jgi:hypothetical protein
MYAGTYPDEVKGILMIDSNLPTDAEVDQLVPEADRPQVVAEVEGNQERVEVYRTLDQAKALLGKGQQTEFVGRFPQGRLVRVRSSLDIDLERPDLVLQEAERILAGASR